MGLFFHLCVHFSKAHNSWYWTRLKIDIRHPIQFSHEGDWNTSIRAIMCCSEGVFVRKLESHLDLGLNSGTLLWDSGVVSSLLHQVSTADLRFNQPCQCKRPSYNQSYPRLTNAKNGATPTPQGRNHSVQCSFRPGPRDHFIWLFIF